MANAVTTTVHARLQCWRMRMARGRVDRFHRFTPLRKNRKHQMRPALMMDDGQCRANSMLNERQHIRILTLPVRSRGRQGVMANRSLVVCMERLGSNTS
jgi:hypothetical protein